MRLTPRSRLGPYEVLSVLGTGGMAEVYRARDTRLGRDVALKVVNEALAGDPELVRRFEQEARLAGSLNHPNLVAVYDVGVQDGAAYFITELLKGESLRERLSRGRIPIQTALDWGAQLAQGLAAAHAQRIIHRDLKPENVFVTSDGHVKLLDFGIAKLTEQSRVDGRHGILDDTVTPTGGATQTGAILGTPAYMSPEQVRGEPVDARTDIFSLGAVLYEMLSGQRPFPGGSLVESGHAILHDEPPPLPDDVPPAVAQVVRRCLEKAPDARIQSARDLAFALELLRAPTGTALARTGRPPSARRFKVLIPLAGAALLLGVVYLGAQSTRRSALPEIEQATFREGTILGARFTPEGRFVLSAAWDGQTEEVYSSVPGAVQLQALGLKDARLLGVSRTGELALMLRPHSRTRIVGTGTLARVPGSGGFPRELAEGVHFADWSPRGELVAVRVVGANYRIERPLGTRVYETSDGWIGDVRVSPNGDHVAFVHHPSSGFTSGSATWSATSGKVMVLDAHNAARVLTRNYLECQGLGWSPSGTEVWFTAGDALIQNTLRAAPLNRAEYEVYRSTGEIRLEDIAADGTILFSSDEERFDMFLESGQIRRNLSWFGGAQPAGLSDDGQLLAFTDIRGMPLEEALVLVRATDGSPPKILGAGLALDLSSDKQTVLVKQEAGLVLLPVGAGTPRAVPTPGFDVQDGRLFRDGKRVVVGARPLDGREYRVFVLEIGSDAGPQPISETPVARNSSLRISPDQRWVAAWGADMAPVVLPIAGGKPIRLGDLPPERGGVPVGWSAGGDLWLQSRVNPPVNLLRVDLATHQIKESRELSPGDLTGVSVMWGIRITPDGSAVAFSYKRVRSRLYLMRGAGVPRN